MARKTLLNEGEIRRFMKLANLRSLTENFIDETEELEEGGMAYARDDEMPEDDAPVDEFPPGLEDEPDAGPPGEVDVMSLVDAIANAISQETGVDVSVDGDEAPEDPMAGEEEAGLPPSPEDEMPPEEEVMQEDEIEEDLAAADISLEEDENISEEDLVNEVTKRVARRLLRQSAKIK